MNSLENGNWWICWSAAGLFTYYQSIHLSLIYDDHAIYTTTTTRSWGGEDEEVEVNTFRSKTPSRQGSEKQKNHPKLLYYIDEAVCALTMVTVNDQSRSLFHFASKVPSSSPALDAVPFQFSERQSFSFLLITEIGSSSWDNGILIRQSTVHHIDTGKEVKVSFGDLRFYSFPLKKLYGPHEQEAP